MNSSGPSNNISAAAVTKCEFCDITLKSDIDVSKHLASIAHSKKRSEFSALNNPQVHNVEKQIPENFSETLRLLKVRSPEDLRILNDRNFFKIKSEDQAQIAEATAQVLLIRFAAFDGKNTELGKGVSELNRRPKVEKNPMAGTSRQAGPSSSSKVLEKQQMPEVRRQQNLKTAQAKRQAEEEELRVQEVIRKAEQEKKEIERNERKRQKESERQKELERQLERQKEAERQREIKRQKEKEKEEENKRQREAQIQRSKQPIPSMDFDRYKINLAIIKVEPKDKDEDESQ